jgi:hypothetical protein
MRILGIGAFIPHLLPSGGEIFGFALLFVGPAADVTDGHWRMQEVARHAAYDGIQPVVSGQDWHRREWARIEHPRATVQRTRAPKDAC